MGTWGSLTCIASLGRCGYFNGNDDKEQRLANLRLLLQMHSCEALGQKAFRAPDSVNFYAVSRKRKKEEKANEVK